MSASAFAFEELSGGSERVLGTPSVSARAAELLERARREAEAVTAEAAERGRAEGFEAGRAEAAAQVALLQQTLEQALAGLEEARDAHLAALSRRAVELALALADKVLARSLALDPSLVVGVVESTLRDAVVRDRIVLAVNPDDLDTVRGAVDDVLHRLGGVERYEVVGERRVGRGGCVVRTEDGDIDGRIEEQLARAAEVLLDRGDERDA